MTNPPSAQALLPSDYQTALSALDDWDSYGEPLYMGLYESTIRSALTLAAENARLRAALNPLARVADALGDGLCDDVGLWSQTSNFKEDVRLTVRDARNAREALNPKPQEKKDV